MNGKMTSNEEDEGELGKIFIRDLLLRCVIGINEFERKEKQDVVVNVEIWSDLTSAAKTDNIKETVDYKEINKNIIKLVENSKFFLVEALAENVAQVCMRNQQVRKVRVTVEKPGALRFARSVGVEIVRKRK